MKIYLKQYDYLLTIQNDSANILLLSLTEMVTMTAEPYYMILQGI